MDKWKQMGRVREEKRREEKRREEQRREEKRSKRESLRRKKIQAREKVGKYRNTVFFQWLVVPEGRKVGSLKRRVRSQLMRDEKLHAVVARSTFRSQNVQNTPCSDHFRKLWRRKSARRCGAKHISKSKCSKHHMFGPLLEVQMSFRVAGARDCAPCQILEHQIFSFGKMILRDRCSTSYDLASLFRGRRNTLDRWSGKIAKRIGTRPPALHSTFHFWRKSRRIASFWCCQLRKMRKSRRIVSFLILLRFQSLQLDRQTDRQTNRKKERKIDR